MFPILFSHIQNHRLSMINYSIKSGRLQDRRAKSRQGRRWNQHEVMYGINPKENTRWLHDSTGFNMSFLFLIVLHLIV
jgi:hypothetical protein